MPNPDFQVRVLTKDALNTFVFSRKRKAMQKYLEIIDNAEEDCHIELVEVHEQFHCKMLGRRKGEQ